MNSKVDISLFFNTIFFFKSPVHRTIIDAFIILGFTVFFVYYI